MAKSALLFALFLLPALALARRPVDYRPMKSPLVLQGKVFCDTCVAGFETSVSTPIYGAKVRVVCKERENSQRETYSQETATDENGCYEMKITEDRGNDVCDAILISSPQLNCAKPSLGRDSARVILTRNNGMCSDIRYANPLGFTKDHPDSYCNEIMKQYQTTDDQY